MDTTTGDSKEAEILNEIRVSEKKAEELIEKAEKV